MPRIEKRMIKVLKGIAKYLDVSLGELIEDSVLHAFEGEGACAFGSKTLEVIRQLKTAYGTDYDAHAVTGSWMRRTGNALHQQQAESDCALEYDACRE